MTAVGRNDGRPPEPVLPEGVVLVRDRAALVALAARCARAERIALDVESNGLFVHRAALCVVQVAFVEEDAPVVAVIDPLAMPIDPLAAVLGPKGPIKVLHDLTFDARLLAEAGAPIGRVRDTSVTARFLGIASTGLSALLADAGVALDKRLQQHNWSRRPLTGEQIGYLAEDVRHLLALDDRLKARAEALGITAEIAEECAYKLACAALPARDTRPSYVRVKGAAALDPVGRAVLRRLLAVRERIAETSDVPPFKVVTNEVLLEVARRRPGTAEQLRAVPGAVSGRATPHVPEWLRAVAQGIADGDVPEEDRIHFEAPKPDKAETTRRRACENRVTGWRRKEARRRGVDEQVVLPGHCAQDLVDLLLSREPDDPGLGRAIAAIAGLGAARLERYEGALLALSKPPPPDEPKEEAAPPPPDLPS
jgi:ribonuclease D